MKNLITIVLLLLFFQNTHAQSCITVADDQNPDQCNYDFCGPYDFSKGVYRLPYPDGTLVHCTNDHFKHCPRGALDMSGASGQSSYNVVASADGWIRAINDEDSEECTCEGGDNCDNNYVWIEHPNGEWTKYTHVRQNSVDDLGLSEDDWVTRGTVIGKEGSVGCSTGDHVHFEVAVPIDTNILLFDEGGGWIDNDWARNLVPVFCGISGNKMVSGGDYFAFDCSSACNSILPAVNSSYGSGVFKVFLNSYSLENTHDFKFQSNSSGELHAAHEIILNPGFEAQSNAVFAARIGECDESALKEAQELLENSMVDFQKLTIFPDPANDLLTLEMKLKSSEPYTLMLRDMTGRTLLLRDQISAESNFIQALFSVSTFADGMYVIELQQGAERWIEKFMVQH